MTFGFVGRQFKGRLQERIVSAAKSAQEFGRDRWHVAVVGSSDAGFELFD